MYGLYLYSPSDYIHQRSLSDLCFHFFCLEQIELLFLSCDTVSSQASVQSS